MYWSSKIYQTIIITMASKCLEGFIFPKMAVQDYRWSFSALMVPVLLLILTPLFFYIKKQYTSAVEKQAVGREWHYLWLIPTTFYLLWYHNIYFSDISSLALALKLSNTIFFLLINLGAMLIYLVVVRLINEQAKRAEQSPSGFFLSSKHSGDGIGLQSIKSIVERYDGACKIEQKGTLFCVSVLLKI